MYFVIGNAGQKYGPVDIDGLRQWVREGRVNGSSTLEVQATGQRVQAASVAELGLGSSSAMAPPAPPPAVALSPSGALTPPGHRPPGTYGAATPYPSSRKSNSSAATLISIILAILLIGGAVAAFFYFRKPAVVGTWTADATAVANKNPFKPASLRYTSYTCTYTFDADGKCRGSMAGEMTNGQRTAKIIIEESGDYKMEGDKGTATIRTQSKTIDGKSVPQPLGATASYEITMKSGELTLKEGISGLSLTLQRKKEP